MILLTKEMQVQEGEQFHFAVVMTPRHHFFPTIYNMLYIYKKSEMHHVSSQYASPYHIIDSVQYFRISMHNMEIRVNV
jgi:hypothetical protein